ncbi:MAG: prolyl oligopeptidase family serine peptidase [Planctomycetota bacterium]
MPRRRCLAFALLPALLAPVIAVPQANEANAAEPASTDSENTAAAGAPEAGEAGYPATRRVDHVDTYHGQQVADPYRWLEEDVRVSDEVAAWVAQQQAYTRAYLDALPQRQPMIDRLTKLWNYERFSQPRKAGDRYLYVKNDGLQNQSVLYLADTPQADGEVLIDPNGWSDDGTIALAGFSPSKDGRYLAYQKSEAGSDWKTIRVMDLETKQEVTLSDDGATGDGATGDGATPDVLRWVKFTGIEWAKDGSGFYYSRYPEPAEGEAFQSVALNRKVFFHKLGDPQSKDRLVYEDPEHPDWGASVQLTEDGRFEVLSVSRGTDDQNQLFYRPAGAEEWTVLSGDFEDTFYLVGETKNAAGGDRFLLYTDHRAPTKRIVAIDLPPTSGNAAPGDAASGDAAVHDPTRPLGEQVVEIIPATDATIEGASLVGGKLIIERLEDVAAKVEVYTLDGQKERDVPLPGVGSVGGFGGEPDDTETFFSYTSYDTPSTVYRYDVATGEATKIRQPTVDFDPDAFVVTREFYDSKDGTRVPIFVAHKRGLERDHTNPTLLYGYGGFNISLTPGFSPSRVAWMEAGGVLAVANLRGGGEYGEEWHQAGKLHNKQNVFDDFIAAAEWLVSTGYTSPERLGIQGGSNGGLLVGAVMTQRPELFGACLPAVGVMDMLRFHKFTAGQFWRDEYGSSDEARDFPVLRAYSPYHNLEPGTHYPATMVVTADTDDRVVPSHSFKFAAALQAAQAGPAPTLLRVESRAGHGAGTPTTKRIEQAADMWAFLLQHLAGESAGGG